MQLGVQILVCLVKHRQRYGKLQLVYLVTGSWCLDSEYSVCRKWQLFITRRVGASNAAWRCYRLHNCGRCQNVSGAVTSLSPDAYRSLQPPSPSPPMCSPPVAREIDISVLINIEVSLIALLFQFSYRRRIPGIVLVV